MILKIIILALVVLTTNQLHAQELSLSVKIKGKVKNFSNKKIYIKMPNLSETLLTDSVGEFNYKTDKLTQPVYAKVDFGKNAQLELYLAPGYDLTITGNAWNTKVLYSSLNLSDIGAKTNQYWKQIFLLNISNPISPLSNEWYNIKPDNFIKIGLEKEKLDSFEIRIQKTIFNKENHDPFKEFFRKMSFVDINVRKLYYLLAYSWMNDLPINQTDSLIHDAINPDLFNSLSFDGYIEDFYYQEVISFFYPDYLLDKQIKNDNSILQNELKRKLEICDSLFNGKTKDYVLQRIIKKEIPDIFNFKQLDLLKSFIFRINDTQIRNNLLIECTNRKSVIEYVAAGEEAPDFNLPDLSGQYHNLRDYRGKVVYIDLWASWCGPCKEELPALKEIYNEYGQNSSKLQIISIAVKDTGGKIMRNKLVNQLQLNWLQLEDKQDFIWNKYKVTFIPRFILIDKKGKILNFDAPRPSEKKVLEHLLDKAIEK